MPINTTHPTYTTEAGDFTSDAYNGDVKHYVPRMSGQSIDAYNAYVNRPAYYNVIKRTTDALIGIMLRKPYTTSINYPIFVADDLSFDTMISYVLRDIFLTSRVGILVDFCEDRQVPMLVPYANGYITNWGDDFVVLKEDYYEVDPKDKYKKEVKCQYRELTLVDGIYTVNIWRKNSRDNKWYVADSVQPQVRGQPLDVIPFVFINDRDTTDECRKPVMMNLAELNVSHFRTMAQIEQLMYFLSTPQPVLIGGFQGSPPTNLAIGQPTVWVLEPGSSLSYVEHSGAGFNSMKTVADTKEAQMQSLGARMLMKAGVESAEALKIRSAGESATLVSMVNALEQGLQQALSYYAMWAGDESPVEFYMNRDFTNITMSPQDISALIQLFQAGHLTQETLMQRLYEGEIVDNVDEELQGLVPTA